MLDRREPGVPVPRPLHRRAHAVAVAEIDVVAHADLVAVIDDGAARQGQQQAVQELHAAAVAVEQRRQPAADAEVQLHVGVVRVGVVHERALFVRHHLERQLVVVSQEEAPLTGRRDRRRVREDVGDRPGVLEPERRDRGAASAGSGRTCEIRRRCRSRAARPRATGWLPPAGSRSPPYSWSITARNSLRIACVSGRFSQLVPSRSTRYGTASQRKPSRPRSSQKRITSSIAPRTAGLS